MLKTVFGFDYVGNSKFYEIGKKQIMPIVENLYELDLIDAGYYATLDKQEFKKQTIESDLVKHDWPQNDIEGLAKTLSNGNNNYFSDLDYEADEHARHQLLRGEYKKKCAEYFAQKTTSIKRGDDFVFFVTICPKNVGEIWAKVSEGFAMREEDYLKAKESLSAQVYSSWTDDGYHAQRRKSNKEKYPSFEACVADKEVDQYGKVDTKSVKGEQIFAISFRELFRQYNMALLNISEESKTRKNDWQEIVPQE